MIGPLHISGGSDHTDRWLGGCFPAPAKGIQGPAGWNSISGRECSATWSCHMVSTCAKYFKVMIVRNVQKSKTNIPSIWFKIIAMLFPHISGASQVLKAICRWENAWHRSCPANPLYPTSSNLRMALKKHILIQPSSHTNRANTAAWWFQRHIPRTCQSAITILTWGMGHSQVFETTNLSYIAFPYIYIYKYINVYNSYIQYPCILVSISMSTSYDWLGAPRADIAVTNRRFGVVDPKGIRWPRRAASHRDLNLTH